MFTVLGQQAADHQESFKFCGFHLNIIKIEAKNR